MTINRDPKGRFIWANAAWFHWLPYLLDRAKSNQALIFEVLALLAKWCDSRRADSLRLAAGSIDREDDWHATYYEKNAERWRIRAVRIRAMSEAIRKEEAAF